MTEPDRTRVITTEDEADPEDDNPLRARRKPTINLTEMPATAKPVGHCPTGWYKVAQANRTNDFYKEGDIVLVYRLKVKDKGQVRLANISCGVIETFNIGEDGRIADGKGALYLRPFVTDTKIEINL